MVLINAIIILTAAEQRVHATVVPVWLVMLIIDGGCTLVSQPESLVNLIETLVSLVVETGDLARNFSSASVRILTHLSDSSGAGLDVVESRRRYRRLVSKHLPIWRSLRITVAGTYEPSLTSKKKKKSDQDGTGAYGTSTALLLFAKSADKRQRLPGFFSPVPFPPSPAPVCESTGEQ